MANTAHRHWLLYAAFLIVVLEGASRASLAVSAQVPFFRPSDAIYQFYPKLREVRQQAKRDPDQATFDILFLGASTLEKSFGTIEDLLSSKLKPLTLRRVRIFNLAKATFTSRDNYCEYRSLMDRKFDLILFYDGINEIRANNCPPDVFRDDYSHYSWYEDVNTFLSHDEIDYFATPYVLHLLATKIRQKLFGSRYIKNVYPNPAWVEYGKDIKTEGSFRKNLKDIVRIADSKNERVLLMSFAAYIPEGYSRQRFNDRSLDYRNHTVPIELWGTPANVAKGLSLHNRVVRDIANAHPSARFVDQDNLIPKNGQYFNDVCHFTGKGCDSFVTNILEPIAEILGRKKSHE